MSQNSSPAEKWQACLCSDAFLKLKESTDPEIKKYVDQLEECDGSTGELESIACFLLLDKSSLKVLQKIFSIYPKDFPHTDGGFLLEVFRLVTDVWRGMNFEIEVNYMEVIKYDMMVVFDHVLSQVHQYFQDGGDSCTNQEFLDDLHVLGTDEFVPDKTRLQAMSIAKQYLTFSNRETELLDSLRSHDE